MNHKLVFLSTWLKSISIFLLCIPLWADEPIHVQGGPGQKIDIGRVAVQDCEGNIKWHALVYDSQRKAVVLGTNVPNKAAHLVTAQEYIKRFGLVSAHDGLPIFAPGTEVPLEQLHRALSPQARGTLHGGGFVINPKTGNLIITLESNILNEVTTMSECQKAGFIQAIEAQTGRKVEQVITPTNQKTSRMLVKELGEQLLKKSVVKEFIKKNGSNIIENLGIGLLIYIAGELGSAISRAENPVGVVRTDGTYYPPGDVMMKEKAKINGIVFRAGAAGIAQGLQGMAFEGACEVHILSVELKDAFKNVLTELLAGWFIENKRLAEIEKGNKAEWDRREANGENLMLHRINLAKLETNCNQNPRAIAEARIRARVPTCPYYAKFGDPRKAKD